MGKREREWRERQERELKALRGWIDGMAERLSTEIDVMADHLCQHWRDAYVDAGMPYGDSDAGLERWLREMASAEPAP